MITKKEPFVMFQDQKTTGPFFSFPKDVFGGAVGQTEGFPARLGKPNDLFFF